MKKELDEKLCKKYPTVFKNRFGDMRQTCMCWGFSCGDGWYDIIERVAAYLEPLGIVASQVKEKFGSLRFYIESCPEDKWDGVYKVIDKAEEDSAVTCELCGKPGKINEEGTWLSCRCPECRVKEQEEWGRHHDR